MIKQFAVWVFGLIFVAALSFPAFADQSIGFRYYFKEGVKALKKHNYPRALRCFEIAQIFDPNDKDNNKYINSLELKPSSVIAQSQPSPPSQAVSQPQPAPVATQPAPSMPAPQAVLQPQPVTVAPPPVIYVAAPAPKRPPEIISLEQITNSGPMKPKLQIEYHSSLIIEGRNIQRFLVVDQNFIQVRTIDTDHLGIDALGIGTTYLHIWDDLGRHSFFVEVVFPQPVNSSGPAQGANGVWHSEPFTGVYSNDWNSYYSGKNIPGLKRQSYELDQSLAVKGETPYGFFDTSGSYTDVDSFSEFDTYTIGLSHIPLEGTDDFNLRGFDALRYLSPLTMPSTRLRGAFADVDLMDDTLGLSISEGQEQQPLAFIPIGGNQFSDSYVDAAKITLFPKSNDQYSFNFATAYGPDHPAYLTDHNYSVQAQHQFNENLIMNAEEGSDSSHDASLASLKWEDRDFKTGLNFRSIDKDYSTVSTLPSYQGETGAVWTSDGEFKNYTESTFLEAYQDHLYSNPDAPNAFNYDANGHLKANINPDFWSDSDFNYVNTAGELSPSSSLGFNERLSRRFGIWNSLQGTVFGGAGYQNSHSSGSDISNYDAEDVIAGIQLPLNHQISTYANYEYYWLDQPDAGGNSNPGVINAGLEYVKQVNPKLSFTSQLDYHDELGVKSGSNSFLSGEQSVIVTAGFNYNPTPDVNFFGDCDASQVLSHIGDPSYDDFEVHLGVKITFGGATYWDPLGTVSGIVFKDRNGDGRFAPGDEGIPGVKIKVGDKEATTDQYGRYHIKIRAKRVDVVPVLDTIPGGLIFSTPQTLNIEIIQGRTSHADFGLISQTGIYGIVFVDRNGSGIPDSGDQFIGKVKVILDGKVIQHSDSHGAFYFRKVQPGEHTISIDINTLGLNMVPLIKLQNKIDVTEGTNYMFNIPVKTEKAQSEEK